MISEELIVGESFMKNKKNLIFDFDGVIVDSFQAALEVNQIIFPELTDMQYRKMFEGNINETMKKYADQKQVIVEENFFYENYPKKLMESAIMHKMGENIRDLSFLYNLFIVSSSKTSTIISFLKKHKLEGCFEEVYGNDFHHSKIEKFKRLFEKYNFTSDDCVFITDTIGDIVEAEEVKLKTIAVSWGFQDKSSLQKSQAEAVIDDPNDLIPEIKRILI